MYVIIRVIIKLMAKPITKINKSPSKPPSRRVNQNKPDRQSNNLEVSTQQINTSLELSE